MNIHPDDHLHVLLDALNELENAISPGFVEVDQSPWLGYTGDADDPKLTRAGYLAVLRHARERLTEELSWNGGLRLINCVMIIDNDEDPADTRPEPPIEHPDTDWTDYGEETIVAPELVEIPPGTRIQIAGVPERQGRVIKDHVGPCSERCGSPHCVRIRLDDAYSDLTMTRHNIELVE